MTTSVGSSKNEDMLRFMVSSYSDERYKNKSVPNNESFDKRLKMFQMSCQLLKNHKIEESQLVEEYNNNFQEVWQLHSSLIGNLKDCIEIVINKTISKNKVNTLGYSEKRKNLKIAIMAIKTLTEKQLQIGNQLSFKGHFCLFSKLLC